MSTLTPTPKAPVERRVTLRQLAEAMKADKTPKATKVYVRSVIEQPVWDEQEGRFRYTVGSACALGGAAVVLGVDPSSLHEAFKEVDCILPGTEDAESKGLNRYGIGSSIVYLNDYTEASKADIGQAILDNCEPLLDNEVVVHDDEESPMYVIMESYV